MARPAPSLLPNPEAEASLRLVRIDGKGMPGHAVAARSQAADVDTHHVPADAGPVVHAPAPSTMHLSSAELRCKLLGEIARDLTRRGGNGAANGGGCMIEHSVGRCRR